MRCRLLLALLGLVIIGGSRPAAASSIYVDPYSGLATVKTSAGTFGAGPFDAWYGQSPTDIDRLPDGEHIGRVYCVDIHHMLGADPDEYYATRKRDTAAGFDDQADRDGDLRQVAWLVNRYGNKVATPYEWASLQLAVWKLSYSSFNYISGLTDTGLMDSFLAEAAGRQAERWQWFDYQGGSPGGQDVLAPVPEPAGLVLFGLALAAAGVAYRRR